MSRPAQGLLASHPEAGAFSFAGGNEAVLLVHGFTGTPAEMLPIARVIHDTLAWACACPLLPGHATLPNDLTDVSLEDWRRCVRLAFENLKERYVKIHLIGLSMGALLCLDLAQEREEDVRSLTLLAPAYRLCGLKQWLMPLLASLPLPHATFLVSKPPSTVPEHVSYREYNLRGVKQLAKLQRRISSNRRGLRVPTLTLYSRNDETTAPPPPTFQGAFLHPLSKTVELKESHHILSLGPEKETVFRHVVEFLSRSTSAG